MDITEKMVEHIARLARLAITPDEKKLYLNQLGKILESMDELKALDTKSIPPTTSVLGLSDVFRDDEAKPFAEIERLLQEAPAREGPYFKVPKVL